MPLYVYSCGHCLKLYEIVVPLKKYGKKIKCPHCKKYLKKLVTSVWIKVA